MSDGAATPAEDPSRLDNIKEQIQETASNLKSAIQSFDVGDEIKERLATLIDQALDELGARIGGQDQSQAQAQAQGQTPEPPQPQTTPPPS